MILTKNYLEKLNANEIKKLSEFVVVENFKHHTNNILPKEYQEDVKSICEEEMHYLNNSEIYVSKNDSGDILGSIRVLKWNFIDVLPIQKIFGINPLNVIGDIELNDIFHIGRFAIKKEGSDIHLFKQLMICAISPICKNKGNVVFAECDSKLLRILTLLGIKATVVGDSIDYLGSETIPICMTCDGLINFYNANKSLVPTTILNYSSKTVKLPKSVVFNSKNDNYSLV